MKTLLAGALWAPGWPWHLVEMLRMAGVGASHWGWREMRMGKDAAAGWSKATDAPEFELHPEGSGEPLKNVKQGNNGIRFAF